MRCLLFREGSKRRIAKLSFVFATVLVTVAPASAYAGDKTSALVESYNTSGQALFDKLAGTPGNIVLSPYSIGASMAMALSGARGDTETEMLRVLRQSLTRPGIDAANAELLAELGQKRPSVKLTTASALVLPNEKAAIAPEYIQTLKTKYAAEVFRTANLAEINGWVERKTEGKIPIMLEELKPTTVALLLNAVYFRADWEAAFKPDQTKDEEFQISASEKARTPMMRQQHDFRYAGGEGYKAIQLPYVDGKIGMVVALPDRPDGVEAIRAQLSGKHLSKLFDNLKHQTPSLVNLRMPRFKAKYKSELATEFQKLGMKLPFDQDKADFSGMVSDKSARLYIESVTHNAVIEVDEKGSEAAASTSVKVGNRSLEPKAPKPETFTIDRPFLFYIVDDATGALVFQGRIVNPRG
jgi:serpin B